MAGHLVSCVPKTLASIGYSRWPRSGVSSPQPESREGRHAHPPSDRSSKAAQPTEPSDRCAAQRAVQLRHRPLRRARHGRGRARGLDMAEVVPEAYELVEHGLITDGDFRDFMFANAVRFWGEANPDFFKGTVGEKAAADVLGNGR